LAFILWLSIPSKRRFVKSATKAAINSGEYLGFITF
jgi:hypothetical protein